MPPEQARGEIDRLDQRCDVFALGAILCEILTGRPPYLADERALAKAVAGELDEARARLRASGCDAELVLLAERCLARDPAGRPASAQDVAGEVTAYLTSVEERARQAQMSAHAARVKAEQERRSRRLTVALAASILIGLGVSLWFLQRAKQQHRAAETAREESDEVTRFLSDMLTAGNPQVAGHDVTVRQILDQAAKQCSPIGRWFRRGSRGPSRRPMSRSASTLSPSLICRRRFASRNQPVAATIRARWRSLPSSATFAFARVG
jgi:serine/threonine protein kinase